MDVFGVGDGGGVGVMGCGLVWDMWVRLNG